MRLIDSLTRTSHSTRLLTYLMAALMLPNIALCFTEGMSWLADAVNISVPAGAYLLLASVSPRIGRTLWWLFIFIFFSAFQIVLLYLFGSSVIAVDMFLNLVTSNPSEMAELLGDMWVILVFVVIFYVPLLVLGVVAVRRRWMLPPGVIRRIRISGAALLLCGGVAWIAAKADGRDSAFRGAESYSATTQLYPANVCCNLGIAVQRFLQTRGYSESSAGDCFKAVSVRSDSLPELYIMIIGETSRACNWQLAGYNRCTNPLLGKRSNLTFFPHTLSESNTTHKSVPMLLTEFDATSYDSLPTRRGIFQPMHEAGFHTLFVSNQQRNHSYIDLLGEQADSAIFLKDAAASAYPDTELISTLSDWIGAQRSAGHRKLFVVLHTYGSHFKYSDRYDQAHRIFTPDGPLFTSPSCRGNLINAYDNTIVATDALIDAAIRSAERSGYPHAGVIYTSDHGEDIFDDERGRFLHASPIPTATQLHVPMLIWLSDAFSSTYPSMASVAKAHSDAQVSSSASLFHTTLHMAGVDTPRLNPALSLLSDAYQSPPRRYLTDHNNAVGLSDTGMDDHDSAHLRSAGIR